MKILSIHKFCDRLQNWRVNVQSRFAKATTNPIGAKLPWTRSVVTVCYINDCFNCVGGYTVSRRISAEVFELIEMVIFDEPRPADACPHIVRAVLNQASSEIVESWGRAMRKHYATQRDLAAHGLN